MFAMENTSRFKAQKQPIFESRLMIKLKRVYEPPSKADGERILVERLCTENLPRSPKIRMPCFVQRSIG
jgi:hypothetical protein